MGMSSEGAVTMTLFAPAFKWPLALSPASSAREGGNQKKATQLFRGSEKSSRLDYTFHASIAPIDLGGIVFTLEMNRIAVDVQLVVAEFDLALVFAEDRVILKYISLE